MLSHDQITKICSNAIGYYCVLVFFTLTTYIVYVFYSEIAPTLLEDEAYGKFLFHFIFGNWLLINIYFNYIMAWLTSPGLSRNYQHLAIQYPVCKKCSYNKPPRTHHCSWCNLCVLRYDHHCPCN
jgi:palmitoyltransferase